MADEIIYSSSGRGTSYGKYEYPIRMIIEHESDRLVKEGGPRDWLYNVEKSNKFAEAVVGRTEFSQFQSVAEGAAAVGDNVNDYFKGQINHVAFAKQFTITRQMMDDSINGIGADTRRTTEAFIRSYYYTQHDLCTKVLVNATQSTIDTNSTTISLCAPRYTDDDQDMLPSGTDNVGLPLFSNGHADCNYFYSTDLAAGDDPAIGDLIMELAVKLRNMKSSNGTPLGYTADTIILPGNQVKLEAAVKRVCGSNGDLGGTHSGVLNLQKNNWNIVILPTWAAAAPTLMVMSDAANKDLGGNMFFNRIKLDIKNEEDINTRNWIWNGYCRFGIGFGSYKHIVRLDSAAAGTATELT